MNYSNFFLKRHVKASLFVCGCMLISGCEKPTCDLEMSVLDIQPQSPKVRQGIAFKYRVRNNGPDILPPGQYSVEVNFNGYANCDDNSGGVSAKAPGEFAVYGRASGFDHGSALEAGLHPYTIRVTPKSGIKDSVLSNNEVSGVILVVDAERRNEPTSQPVARYVPEK